MENFILIILCVCVAFLVIVVFMLPIVMAIELVRIILFNPSVNSVISIPFIVYVMYKSFISDALKIILVISVIDCIRDIRIAKEYYYPDFDIHADVLYKIKSITSLFTLGLARSIFLLIVDPLISLSASSKVNDVLKKKKIIPYSISWDIYSPFYASFQYTYRCNKLIQKKLGKGKIVLNKVYIDEEFEEYQEKVNNVEKNAGNAYEKFFREKNKKGFIRKFIDKMNGNEEKIKAEEEKIKADLEKVNQAYNVLRHIPNYCLYMDIRFYNECKQSILHAMENHGMLSPQDIVALDELKWLNALQENDYGWSSDWIVYFVISILKTLVQDGFVEEVDWNDDVLENHQYRHVNGVSVKCRNLDDDPRFALDDD